LTVSDLAVQYTQLFARILYILEGAKCCRHYLRTVRTLHLETNGSTLESVTC